MVQILRNPGAEADDDAFRLDEIMAPAELDQARESAGRDTGAEIEDDIFRLDEIMAADELDRGQRVSSERFQGRRR